MEAPLLQVSSEEERSGGYGTREKESVLLYRGDKTGIVESQDGEFVNIEVSLQEVRSTCTCTCKPELASYRKCGRMYVWFTDWGGVQRHCVGVCLY